MIDEEIRSTARRLSKKAKRLQKYTQIRRRSLRKFVRTHSYQFNLVEPKTYNDKLLYRKLNQTKYLESLAPLVDKYEVRNYVQEKIGSDYLIPLLNYYTSSEDLKFDELPNQFILKATHGSGWNYIVRNKSAIDQIGLRQLVSAWLECNYCLAFTGEAQYKSIRPGVVAEELILDENGNVPTDYKFLSFNNGTEMIIQSNLDRFNEHRINFHDTNWNKLDYKLNYPSGNKSEPPPQNLQDLIRTAKLLASDFDYCRVDLYSLNNQIYFGELTFVPGNATEKITPTSWDQRLGSFWNLDRFESDRIQTKLQTFIDYMQIKL